MFDYIMFYKFTLSYVLLEPLFFFDFIVQSESIVLKFLSISVFFIILKMLKTSTFKDIQTHQGNYC